MVAPGYLLDALGNLHLPAFVLVWLIPLVMFISCLRLILFNSWGWMRFLLCSILHSFNWLPSCTAWLTSISLESLSFCFLFPAFPWCVYGPWLVTTAPMVQLLLVTMENKLSMLMRINWRILFPSFLQLGFLFMTSHWQFISMCPLFFKYWVGSAHVIMSKVQCNRVGMTVSLQFNCLSLWVSHGWSNWLKSPSESDDRVYNCSNCFLFRCLPLNDDSSLLFLCTFFLIGSWRMVAIKLTRYKWLLCWDKVNNGRYDDVYRSVSSMFSLLQSLV